MNHTKTFKMSRQTYEALNSHVFVTLGKGAPYQFDVSISNAMRSFLQLPLSEIRAMLDKDAALQVYEVMKGSEPLGLTIACAGFKYCLFQAFLWALCELLEWEEAMQKHHYERTSPNVVFELMDFVGCGHKFGINLERVIEVANLSPGIVADPKSPKLYVDNVLPYVTAWDEYRKAAKGLDSMFENVVAKSKFERLLKACGDFLHDNTLRFSSGNLLDKSSTEIEINLFGHFQNAKHEQNN